MNKITEEMALAVAPRSFEQLMQFSETAAQTDLVPKAYKGKPHDVFIAAQWGLSLGMHPIQAIQNIAVINGRPSIYGDAMIGVVRASGKLEAIKEEWDEMNKVAICTVKRVGEEPVVERFGFEDAKKANLLNKQGPWSQYPKRMCKFRARGFALRDTFADILGGMITAEEAGDMKEVSVTVLSSSVPSSAPATTTRPAPSEVGASAEDKKAFYDYVQKKGLSQFLTVEEKTQIAQGISLESMRYLMATTLPERKRDVESAEVVPDQLADAKYDETVEEKL